MENLQVPTPTNKMVIDALMSQIKGMFQEEEIVKLKQENANLKYELKEVA